MSAGEQDPAAFLESRLKGLGPGEKAPTVIALESTRLMLAAKAGDGEAFDALVRRLRGRAYKIAHGLVGSREDAMDLAQEAFLKVFRARDTFREGELFLPWFHRILRNTCFSFLRQRGRLRKRSLSAQRPGADADEGDWELADESAAHPGDELVAAERATAFRAAFAALSARDREIITLRHFQDLSYREIADSLGIPQGTVMSRLFHARRRLRERLGPMIDELPSAEEAGIPASGDASR